MGDRLGPKYAGKGLSIKLSLNELIRLSQLTETGNSTQKIKRQLNRLVRMSMSFINIKGHRWDGPLINDVLYTGQGRNAQVNIEFNRFMITFYRLHAFTTFDRSKSRELKGDSSAFYLFYSSHSTKEMAVSVDRCKKLLAIDSSFDKKEANKRVKKAVENLVKSGVMNPEKTYVKDGKVFTSLAITQ